MGGPEALTLNPWTALAALLITSGFAKYLIDLYREYRHRKAITPPPPTARQAEIDQSMLAMSKANERLEEENKRLRQANIDFDEMLRRERVERATERESYQREIRTLEQRLREMSSEISELLRQVGEMSQRHDTGDIPAVGGGFSRTPATTNNPYQPYDHSTTEIRED